MKKSATLAWLLPIVMSALAGTLSFSAGPPAAAGATPAAITFACPGAQCPYTPPTAAEQGAAEDLLARINLERAVPARNYTYQGTTASLSPLLPASASAQQTAQAAAEWEAVNSTLADYSGPDPSGYSYATASNAAVASDTAGIDDVIMHSYGHALAVLSAAPTQVAVGAACSPGGTLYVTEEFFDTSETTWTAGQARFAAELSENNVYTQSGGSVTTVTDTEGTGPAKDYLPQQPIVAGDNSPYATGADWTCSGVRYPPGNAPVSPLPAPVISIASSADGGGYLLADAEGAVSVHGDASFHGGANGLALALPVVAMAATPDGGGYWMVGADGGVFAFGDAAYAGSLPGLGIHVSNIVDLVPDPGGGGGYWLIGRDGGVFAFGGAPFVGSLPGLGIHVSDVVGAVPTASGAGYWLVGADGGVFAFGNAGFVGSLPGLGVHVDDVVGIAPAPGGGGYWLVGADGGVFAFGDAPFVGSMGGKPLAAPVVGIAAPPSGAGYWLVGADGGVFAFGVPFEGAD